MARHASLRPPPALLLVPLLLALRARPSAGDCALLGACRPPGGDAFSPRSVNCASPARTAPLSPPPGGPPAACPEYGTSACCDAAQAASLAESLAHARLLFGRCPACADNLRRLWCAFTCSPDQARGGTWGVWLAAPLRALFPPLAPSPPPSGRLRQRHRRVHLPGHVRAGRPRC